MPDEVRWEQRGQLAGVAVEHLGAVEDGRVDAVVVAGEVEVGAGDVDPVRLVLDAGASEVDGLDEGGADPDADEATRADLAARLPAATARLHTAHPALRD